MKYSIKDLIPGNIYYFKTFYEWIVRFTYIKDGSIIGDIKYEYGKCSKNYANDIESHVEIRPATIEEIALLQPYIDKFPFKFKEITYEIFN